jgi:hypothetical protein
MVYIPVTPHIAIVRRFKYEIQLKAGNIFIQMFMETQGEMNELFFIF